ncbi:MAG: hypothetical protein LBM65_00065 [Oscillospiraceae bacterium]|jgi:hypothetical protein|nr:hypothetical protein [Oscillospiraceae bacterium]
MSNRKTKISILFIVLIFAFLSILLVKDTFFCVDKKMEISYYDFTVDFTTTTLKVGMAFNLEEINETLKNHSPANEKRAYEIYSYEDFIVEAVFSNKTGEYIIGSLTLISPKYTTHRGIKIGDTVADVFEKYGEKEQDEDGTISYLYDRKHIYFRIDNNGIVTGISLDML